MKINFLSPPIFDTLKKVRGNGSPDQLFEGSNMKVITAPAGRILRPTMPDLVLSTKVVPATSIEVHGNGRKMMTFHVGDIAQIGTITSITNTRIVIDSWLNLTHAAFAFRVAL